MYGPDQAAGRLGQGISRGGPPARGRRGDRQAAGRRGRRRRRRWEDRRSRPSAGGRDATTDRAAPADLQGPRGARRPAALDGAHHGAGHPAALSGRPPRLRADHRQRLLLRRRPARRAFPLGGRLSGHRDRDGQDRPGRPSRSSGSFCPSPTPASSSTTSARRTRSSTSTTSCTSTASSASTARASSSISAAAPISPTPARSERSSSCRSPGPTGKGIPTR